VDGQHAIYAVKITVRRGEEEPETFEYPSARVVARPGRDLVITRPWNWGRAVRRYRPGQWTGYDVELVFDRRRDIRRRRGGRRRDDQ
jgi:hypothetical protein